MEPCGDLYDHGMKGLLKVWAATKVCKAHAGYGMVYKHFVRLTKGGSLEFTNRAAYK